MDQMSFAELPDDIIICILKKLNNCDVLYSLLGVNKRLHAIASMPTFAKDLTLMETFNDDLLVELNHEILDRFCYDILPQIRHKLERLYVKSSSMERILLASSYSNLHTLGIYDLEPNSNRDLFSDSYLIRHFGQTLKSIYIKIKQHEHQTQTFQEDNIFIFEQICTAFKNLQDLNYMGLSDDEQLTFAPLPSIELTSNLVKLNVMVDNIHDCLYLLNDHFYQLQSLFVTICSLDTCGQSFDVNLEKIPNLKCFTIIHLSQSLTFHEILPPLLQRMINLEELNLFFKDSFGDIVDGNYLLNNIINHMIKLKKFIFNIRSAVRLNKQFKLPSNEEIQNSFTDFQTYEIISYVDYFEKFNLFYCTIYSYPYPWKFYYNISNNFPGGLFQSVREISLYDECPFEHEFFLQISQSFPFIKKLVLHNRQPQEKKYVRYPIIKYPYLTHINLAKAHEDYVEEFLNNTMICLSNNIHLHTNYDQLKKATDDFKKDEMRINSSKIISLTIFRYYEKEHSKLNEYFPYAKIY